MKNKELADKVQTAYLLEYEKRKIKVCADTLQNLAQIFGEEDREDTFASDTVFIWDEQIKNTEQQERTSVFINQRIAEERLSFAGNFREMADMMNEAAEDSVRFISLGKRRTKRIVKGLLGEGLIASDLYLVQHNDGRTELSVMLSSRNGNSGTVEEAADYLSVLLDIRLVSAKRNPFFIGTTPVCCFFEEEPDYIYLTGSARAVKETESVSGDSFSFFEAEDGNLTVVLSDGMGSGEEACRDSEAVADMTENLLESGLRPQTAVQIVNSAVIGEGEGDRLPTLDLCSIDLYEGKVLFLKNGAAASFIKQGRAVETITAAALPLGTFGKAQAECTRREVTDGDMIILVSDGVTEVWPEGSGEEKIRRFLSDMESVSPTETANRLLRYAIGECEGRIRDDMTILAVGIWEKAQEV